MKKYRILARTRSEIAMLNASKHPRSNAIYSVNEDFFKIWTPESSWIFGWILGDGTFTNGYILELALARKDKEVLFKIRDIMDSEHPVTDYAQWDKKHQKYYYKSRIRISSKKIIDDLQDLNYSNIDHINHFIRGFFEAEGSVEWHRINRHRRYIRTNFTNNDKTLLDFILFHLRENQIIEGGGIYPNGGTYNLSFSEKDSISLYHYIYDNCGNMFLKRKKEKFEELIKSNRKGVEK